MLESVNSSQGSPILVTVRVRVTGLKVSSDLKIWLSLLDVYPSCQGNLRVTGGT